MSNTLILSKNGHQLLSTFLMRGLLLFAMSKSVIGILEQEILPCRSVSVLSKNMGRRIGYIRWIPPFRPGYNGLILQKRVQTSVPDSMLPMGQYCRWDFE